MLHRGTENMENITKNTFKLEYDEESRITYLRKVEDEITKNHQETDSEVITGFMPQIIDIQTGLPHKLCLIRSYENYIGQLKMICFGRIFSRIQIILAITCWIHLKRGNLIK